MSKIVIALGGNALGKNPQEQHDRIESTVKYLIDFYALEEVHFI